MAQQRKKIYSFHYTNKDALQRNIPWSQAQSSSIREGIFKVHWKAYGLKREYLGEIEHCITTRWLSEKYSFGTVALKSWLWWGLTAIQSVNVSI